MPSAQMLNGSWKNGAATSSAGSDGFEIPNLCTPLAVFGVVLASQLLALLLTLAGQPGWWAFYSHLAQTALLLLWIGLLSAALLCRLRGWLARFKVPEGSVITFVVVMGSVAAVSEAAFWLGRILGAGPDTGGGWFPTDHLAFLTRNLAIGMLVTAPLLRYFYVSQQWQRNVRREAESRLNALQARIRPHFLFNSMNTIAALTRTNAQAAEQAVEDLADLFRASLRDGRQLIPLREELEIARVYERMEQHRLGNRLQVDWQLGPLPEDTPVPGLVIQPLLENAIYHGIEPMPQPGRIQVSGESAHGSVRISISNPLPPAPSVPRHGNRIALENIRERLELAFGARGVLSVIDTVPGRFTVTIEFPAGQPVLQS